MSVIAWTFAAIFAASCAGSAVYAISARARGDQWAYGDAVAFAFASAGCAILSGAAATLLGGAQ